MYHRGFVSSYEAMYHVVPAESKYQKGDSIPPVMKASAISNGLRCRRDKKHDYKRCDWRRGWRWRAWSWVVDTVPDPTSHWNLKMTNDRQLSVQNSFRVRRTSHPADIVRPGQRLWLWPCGFPGRNRENVSCDQSRISTVQISAPILPIIRDSFKRAYIRQHEEWEGEGAPLLEPMHPSPLQQTCTFVKNGSCSGMPSTLATKTSSWVLTFFIFNFQTYMTILWIFRANCTNIQHNTAGNLWLELDRSPMSPDACIRPHSHTRFDGSTTLNERAFQHQERMPFPA